MQKAFMGTSFRHILVILLGALAAFILSTSLHRTLGWVGRPYPGFLLNPNGIVSSIQPYGVGDDIPRYPSYLTHVDGKKVRDSRDVYRSIREMGADKEPAYTITQKDGTISVSVRTRVFSAADFISTFGFYFLGGMTGIGLALFLLWLIPSFGPSLYLAGLSGSAGFWCLLVPDYLTDHQFLPLLFPPLTAVFPFGVLFSLSFPERRERMDSRALHIALWSCAALLLLGYYTTVYRPEPYKIVDLSAYIAGIITAGTILSSVLYCYFRSPSLEARKRAQVVVWATGISVPVVILSIGLIYMYGLAGLAPAVSFTIFWVLSLFYATLKHNIFEIDEAARRWTTRLIVIAGVSAIYIAFLSLFNLAFARYGLTHSPVFPLVSAIFIVMIFNPLRDRVTILVDKLFFRERYEAQRVLEEVGEAVVSILDMGELFNRVIDATLRAMGAGHASAMVRERHGMFAVVAVRGALPTELTLPGLEESHPLITLMEKEGVVVKREESRGAEISLALEGLRSSLIVPLIHKERLIGTINLGAKLSGASYTREDIRLLRSLANQTALALENARLVKEEKEKERMAQELSTARMVQTSLLPASAPEVPGLELLGDCFPAREVGGDYYDYIPLSGRRVGVAIGDVTGKGVPAALLMAMVKGAIQSELTVSGRPLDMLIRLNRTVCTSGTKQLITFLYSVIDVDKGLLLYANAGHTFPYLVRDGLVMPLEQGGFPLGVSTSDTYQEAHVELKHKDTLIFYTDGIVEAENSGREMFGFERFEDVIRNNASLSPSGLKDAIMRAVEEHSGGTLPADDMTLVIARYGVKS